MRFRLNPIAPNGVDIEPEITTVIQRQGNGHGAVLAGKDGKVQKIVAGTNITVDSTDPANPIVSSTGGGGGGTGISRSISSISTATNAGSASSTDYIYLVSGATTLTLPTAIGNTNRYTVTNVGTNTVTVATTSAQTINGSSSATLPIANMSLDFISDGSNWHVE